MLQPWQSLPANRGGPVAPRRPRTALQRDALASYEVQNLARVREEKLYEWKMAGRRRDVVEHRVAGHRCGLRLNSAAAQRSEAQIDWERRRDWEKQARREASRQLKCRSTSAAAPRQPPPAQAEFETRGLESYYRNVDAARRREQISAGQAEFEDRLHQRQQRAHETRYATPSTNMFRSSRASWATMPT